jgi:hypothetical protein
MVFVDADRYRSARMAGISREALYRGLLARSVLLAETSTGAELVGRADVCDATCGQDPEPVGDGFLKVGEAAFALDPLSSTGVQKALQTAWSGAIAVHTILTRPADREAAQRFYAESHRAIVERHTAWTAGYYAEARQNAGRPFWRRRALAAASRPRAGTETALPPTFQVSHTPLRLSAAAALVEAPCLVGDVMETRRALIHPDLERPVAFLDGVEIAPLLEGVSWGVRLEELIALWSRRLPYVPPQQIAALAGWLIHRGILVPG